MPLINMLCAYDDAYFILFLVVSSRNLLSDLSLADVVTDGVEAACHSLEAKKRTPLGDVTDAGAVREENPRPAALAVLRRRSRKERAIFLATIFVVAFVAGSLAPLLEDILDFVLNILAPV